MRLKGCVPWLVAAAAMVPSPSMAIEFSAAQRLPMPQNAYYNLEARTAAIGDANGDGRMDVAFFTDGYTVGGDRSQDYLAYIYEQQADGTMALQSRFSFAPDGEPLYDLRASALVDLDGDGIAEIVLDALYEMVVLKRSPSGTYAEASRVARPMRVAQITTKDLNDDGLIDLMAQGEGGRSIHYNLGNLAFAPPLLVTGHPSGSGIVADLNNDGVPDLISTTSYFSVNVNIRHHPGVMVRTQADPYGSPLFLQPQLPEDPNRLGNGFIAVGRFPGDTAPQVALVYIDSDRLGNVLHYYLAIAIFGWSPDGILLPRINYRLAPAQGNMDAPVATHDLDGDGDDDLVILYPGQPRILLQEYGAFLPVYTPPATASTSNYNLGRPIHVADFNGDGCLDIGYPDRGLSELSGTGYSIHYRLDCPSTNASATPKDPQNRPTQHDPAKPLLHPDVPTNAARSERPRDIQAPRHTR